jgi:hypothetical protein
MVAGTRAHAEALTDEVAAVLATMGLRLSEAKTSIRHIEEGVDFLGFRIQRHQQRGSQRRYVYTYPSKKALAAVKATVRTLTTTMRNQPLTGPAAPAQLGAAGLDHLLPPRVILGDLRLPARLCMAAGGVLATPQAPAHQLEAAAPPLPARVVADAG